MPAVLVSIVSASICCLQMCGGLAHQVSLRNEDCRNPRTCHISRSRSMWKCLLLRIRHALLVLFCLLAVLDDIALFEEDILQSNAPPGLMSQEEFQVHSEVLELLLLGVLHNGASLAVP